MRHSRISAAPGVCLPLGLKSIPAFNLPLRRGGVFRQRGLGDVVVFGRLADGRYGRVKDHARLQRQRH